MVKIRLKTLILLLLLVFPFFLYVYQHFFHFSSTSSAAFQDTSKHFKSALQLKESIEEISATPSKKPFLSSSSSSSSSSSLPHKRPIQPPSNPFANHLYFKLHKHNPNISLEDYMFQLSKLPSCHSKPLFISMARVKSPLYRQLLQNFFYSMLRFNLQNCAVMICISDFNCLESCSSFGFPCFDYQHPLPSAHVMVQIATLKLYHIGQVLKKGVNVMVLDMDIGFLQSPMRLLDSFFEKNSTEQVRSQTDIGYVMEQRASLPHLRGSWFTTPRANFGLFIAKAHKLTIRAFRCAWKSYGKVH